MLFCSDTGCSIIIVFFPLNVVIFLNSAISAAAELLFYLPFRGSCMKSGVHTEERPESGIYFKIFKKKKHNI